MRAVDRYKVIEVVARFLADLPASKINAIMSAAHYNQELDDDDWQPDGSEKLDELKYYLGSASDDILSSLTDFLPDNARLQLPDFADPASVSLQAMKSRPMLDGPIFVVHGHARGALHETVRVLERGTGREVMVLREQPNMGRTILEKFEEHAASAAFAVVLLTADDEGGIRATGDMQLRGRQNVIFELGFFFGKLGRKRVAVLLEKNVEKPSDIDGLVYITLDSAGTWKQVLARELETAGISVDRSRIP